MIDDSVHPPKFSITDVLFVVFLRIVAFIGIWLGLEFWAMLVGYSHNGLARFDLLTVPWRVATCALAVIFPVAGIGLWMTVSWGPVIWFIGALTQILMYGVWPQIFGENPLLIAFHIIVVVVYAAFCLAIMLEKRDVHRS
ncbi:DUF6163 family protein [Rhizobium sp.]|uniref:DUF6163 family protein n=1 Tax=Rhizobium sp. TaxID=391 RepID=UPI000E9A4B0B|nr:hypothetical protein [Rhizobium sp.]